MDTREPPQLKRHGGSRKGGAEKLGGGSAPRERELEAFYGVGSAGGIQNVCRELAVASKTLNRLALVAIGEAKIKALCSFGGGAGGGELSGFHGPTLKPSNGQKADNARTRTDNPGTITCPELPPGFDGDPGRSSADVVRITELESEKKALELVTSSIRDPTRF